MRYRDLLCESMRSEIVRSSKGTIYINPSHAVFARLLRDDPHHQVRLLVSGDDMAAAGASEIVHHQMFEELEHLAHPLVSGFEWDRGDRTHPRGISWLVTQTPTGVEVVNPATTRGALPASEWPQALRRAIGTRLTEARIIAYHGTGSKITHFNDGFLTPNYFTQDMNYARAYMGGKTKPRRQRSRNYIVTVELTIDRMFDTKRDDAARAYYNEKFVPFINPYRKRMGKPLARELAAGEWPSFTVADHLWGFMLEVEAPYDGMLIDEGGLTDAPAIIPFRASQIKVLKNQIVKPE